MEILLYILALMLITGVSAFTAIKTYDALKARSTGLATFVAALFFLVVFFLICVGLLWILFGTGIVRFER